MYYRAHEEWNSGFPSNICHALLIVAFCYMTKYFGVESMQIVETVQLHCLHSRDGAPIATKPVRQEL